MPLTGCLPASCGPTFKLEKLTQTSPSAGSSFDPLVDSDIDRCYTVFMMTHTEPKMEHTVRKKRSDRNHIIYELVVNGLNYIGVTAKTESTVLKSVRARAAKHFYRAKTENKDWSLCVALRALQSKEEIEIKVHEIVRGKAAAHKREVEIRRAVKPALNTDKRGD